jgi:hypothetical protein
MCAIIMLIFGIVALATGRFSLTRKKVVEGAPARIVGVILILPLPVTFLAGLALGVSLLQQGRPVNEKEVRSLALVIDIGVPVLALIAAIAVSAANAHEARRKRPPREEEEYEYDEGYRIPRRPLPPRGEDAEPPILRPIDEEPPRPRQPPDDRYRD